jgi:hypothetical protein
VLKVNIQNSVTKMTVSEAIDRVRSTRGVLGFWGGVRIGLVQALPSTVIYMTSYEYFKEQFKSMWFGPAAAGAVGRFVSCSIISPLELIRTIQTGGSKQTAFQLIDCIYRNEGLRGFYRGWWSSIMRDCPFSAIYWFSFEQLQPQYNAIYKSCVQARINLNSNSSYDGTDDGYAKSLYSSYSHLVTFLSGATSGVLAAVSTHPFDVIKTQQQLAKHVVRPLPGAPTPPAGACGKPGCTRPGCSPTGVVQSIKQKIVQCTDPRTHAQTSTVVTTVSSSPLSTLAASKVDCSNVKVEKCQVPKQVNRAQINIFTLYRAEGMNALFRGLSMRLMTVIPSSAIMVTVYKGITEIVAGGR